MPKSYCNLLYHIVFSTKGREPWLKKTLRPRIHQYLGGAIKGAGGIPLIINGTADHIHIIAKLRQDKAVCDVLRSTKSGSSAWIHKTFQGCRAFAWQSGYGAFTVSKSQIGRARQYVETQEEHHRRTTFKDEFIALLKAHGMEYDERHLWD